MRKPNLFIIGATKCGTTSLHAYLGVHPQIFMCEPKEPGFFLDRHERHPAYARRCSDREDLVAYLRLFEQADGAVVLGEASTGYSHAPHRSGVAERIHAFNPAAKIIYMVREPVARTVSHYWWNVRNEGERRPIAEALHPGSLYLDTSNYAMQIGNYLRIFSAEQITIITLEDLQARPQEILKDLFSWLGVDDTFSCPNCNEVENRTPQTIVYPRWRWTEKLRYTSWWTHTGRFVPQSLRRAARRFSEHRVARADVDTSDVEGFLRTIHCEQVKALEAFLGRTLTEWQTTREAHTEAGCVLAAQDRWSENLSQ